MLNIGQWIKVNFETCQLFCVRGEAEKTLLLIIRCEILAYMFRDGRLTVSVFVRPHRLCNRLLCLWSPSKHAPAPPPPPQAGVIIFQCLLLYLLYSYTLIRVLCDLYLTIFNFEQSDPITQFLSPILSLVL